VGYRTEGGDEITGDRIDLIALVDAAGRILRHCPQAGAMALAVAAALPGTLVHEVARTLPGCPHASATSRVRSRSGPTYRRSMIVGRSTR
jgi:2-methylaconitate cis-trans-isomerase PrpF